MEAYARYEVLLRSKADANERVFKLGFLKVWRVVDARVVANKLCAESIFAHCIISFYGWQRSTCSFMRWVFEYPWMCVFFSFRVFFVLSFFERESIWCFARSCLHFINFSNVSYECKRKFWETNLIYTISKKAVKITELPRISRQKNIVKVNKAVKSNALIPFESFEIFTRSGGRF